jgi:hypothetical protein
MVRASLSIPKLLTIDIFCEFLIFFLKELIVLPLRKKREKIK